MDGHCTDSSDFNIGGLPTFKNSSTFKKTKKLSHMFTCLYFLHRATEKKRRMDIKTYEKRIDREPNI